MKSSSSNKAHLPFLEAQIDYKCDICGCDGTHGDCSSCRAAGEALRK